MEDKNVVLLRKQPMPFVVNYPSFEGKTKEYVWTGTVGKTVNKRPVPYEVFEWLKNNTSTFESGELILEQTDDEEVLYAKETIQGIEEIEECVLTKEEIKELLEKGNHLTLAKSLKKLTDGDKAEGFISSTRRYVLEVAQEIGIDSSAKRKAIAQWADLDFENSEFLFDKELDNLYS